MLVPIVAAGKQAHSEELPVAAAEESVGAGTIILIEDAIDSGVDLETARFIAKQISNGEGVLAPPCADPEAIYGNVPGCAIAGAAGEDIQSVITRVYPRARNLVFVIIGDAELIRNDIAKYGPVTEMAITEPRFTP